MKRQREDGGKGEKRLGESEEKERKEKKRKKDRKKDR